MNSRMRSPQPVTEPNLPLANSLGNHVRVTSRLFDRAMANRLKACGIPYGMWGFLRRLWEKDGQTQLELATALDLTGSTAVTAINRMAAVNLIRRERSATDRRNVHVYLTHKGLALEKQLLPIAHAVHDAAFAHCSKQEFEAFRTVLQLIEEALTMDQRRFANDKRRHELLTRLEAIES